MDKLVIDIETKNTFADVGGAANIEKLQISFVGVFSYKKNEYLSFFENELDKLGPVLQSAGLIVGFSSNRFDIPVLNAYYPFNVKAIESLDILDDIEEKLGHRVSLDQLAHTNLKTGKTAHGLEAIKFYNEGRFEELKSYCLNDVKITKDLYELGMKQGWLLVPTNHGKEIVKVDFNWQHRLPSTGMQTLF
ncbi:ribonuclease H-like domain-containing protein [Patescibacteria group bacterium]|nr:ribonuclease H-like domain-containing protein [Patescibacteria group bacterium]MDE2020360.1 ribonuclease H-like domain-containing protein [Patescibacteria group bacterium]